MHRNQRMLYRYPRNYNVYRKEKHEEVEEVYPPKAKRISYKMDKPMTNRCCNIAPEQKDFAQSTEPVSQDQYQNLLLEQYGFDPLMPDTMDQIKELKKVLCGSSPKIETASQYDPVQEIKPLLAEAECGFEWQDIDTADDIDKFLTLGNNEMLSSKDIEISEIPKIKIIAEKYLKFKKDNIEVRKLEEKIVCIEYDVYKKDIDVSIMEPVQMLRVYFSVKMSGRKDAKNCLPSTVKLKYNITNEDLSNMNDKEVEIIDGKISDNRPYLEDLKKILKRRQAIYEKKNKTSLDLTSLYEMAKRDVIVLDDDYSNMNLLSKAELEEIKDLITKKCASSIHGINRRTLKSERGDDPKKENAIKIISESIFNELLRNVEK